MIFSLLVLASLTACDQMGGGKGDSGGMGSQSDRDFQRGVGAAQQGPKDPSYRSGQSASEPNPKTNNPASPSGGTAGWPTKKPDGSINDDASKPGARNTQ